MVRECLCPVLLIFTLLLVSLVTSTPFFLQTTVGVGSAWTLQTSSASSPVWEWMNNSSTSTSGSYSTRTLMLAVASLPNPLLATQMYVPSCFRDTPENVSTEAATDSFPSGRF